MPEAIDVLHCMHRQEGQCSASKDAYSIKKDKFELEALELEIN